MIDSRRRKTPVYDWTDAEVLFMFRSMQEQRGDTRFKDPKRALSTIHLATRIIFYPGDEIRAGCHAMAKVKWLVEELDRMFP